MGCKFVPIYNAFSCDINFVKKLTILEKKKKIITFIVKNIVCASVLVWHAMLKKGRTVFKPLKKHFSFSLTGFIIVHFEAIWLEWWNGHKNI